MLRKILLGGILSLASCLYTEKPLPPRRTIDVCIAYEQHEPVKEAVREAFTFANNEFETHVNISHRIQAETEYNAPANTQEPYEQVITQCPEDIDLYFLITNEVPTKTTNGITIVDSNPHGIYSYWLGKHFVEVYQARNQSTNTLTFGIPALNLTILHELGHVWGANHVEDTDSFMYEALRPTKVKWDKTTTETILNNRDLEFKSGDL